MSLSLTWVPVSSRPDLLAEPVLAAVQALPVEVRDAVEVVEIDPDHADTAVLVELTGMDMEDMANCIVIAGARAGEDRVCAALVLGHTRADVNKTVRRLLDVRKCSFMPMDQAVGRTGMEYGGITPVGLPEGWPVLVDSRVVERDHVVIGSGLRRSKLRLPGSAAASLAGAQVIEDLALEL